MTVRGLARGLLAALMAVSAFVARQVRKVSRIRCRRIATSSARARVPVPVPSLSFGRKSVAPRLRFVPKSARPAGATASARCTSARHQVEPRHREIVQRLFFNARDAAATYDKGAPETTRRRLRLGAPPWNDAIRPQRVGASVSARDGRARALPRSTLRLRRAHSPARPQESPHPTCSRASPAPSQ